MMAQIVHEWTDDDGHTNRTYITLADPQPYNPTVAGDLLSKVKASYEELVGLATTYDDELEE